VFLASLRRTSPPVGNIRKLTTFREYSRPEHVLVAGIEVRSCLALVPPWREEAFENWNQETDA
jgi:hypothetical protein